MTEERSQCLALTKAGARCKNSAMAGSEYCHVHQTEGEASLTVPDEAPQPVRSSSPQYRGKEDKSIPLSDADRVEFQRIATELRELSAHLQQESRYTPPAFSLAELAALLQKNIYRFTPQAQREIVETLRSNLRGTKPQDLVDPETWKGFWYVLNYMAQSKRSDMSEQIQKRLEAIPGMTLLADVGSGLKDTDPKEFLDPDTWKGLYYVIDRVARLQVDAIKHRILGRKGKHPAE